MANTSNPIKAIESLRITGPPSESRPHLLTMPQELKNEIWEMVLGEPTLCHKRHHPDCDFYNPQDTQETPPIELLQDRQGHENSTERAHDSKTARCAALCVRRKGLDLLRVNRQVYNETSKMFWGMNSICLRSPEDAERITEFGVLKVRQLIVWDQSPDRVSPNKVKENADKVLAVVERMPDLQRIEISCDMLGYNELERLGRCSKLKEIRVWQFHSVGAEVGGSGILKKFYLGIHRDFRLPADCCKGRDEKGFRSSCSDCWKRNAEIRNLADEWVTNANRHHLSGRYMDWVEATKALLEQEMLPRQEDGPRVVTVKIGPGKNGEMQVSVWGLPPDTPEEWREGGPARRKKEASLDEALPASKANRGERIGTPEGPFSSPNCPRERYARSAFEKRADIAFLESLRRGSMSLRIFEAHQEGGRERLLATESNRRSSRRTPVQGCMTFKEAQGNFFIQRELRRKVLADDEKARENEEREGTKAESETTAAEEETRNRVKKWVLEVEQLRLRDGKRYVVTDE